VGSVTINSYVCGFSNASAIRRLGEVPDSGLLGGGYYWYTQQQEIQKRLRTPSYFVNHGPTVIRPC
jgi:hypothetical protein